MRDATVIATMAPSRVYFTTHTDNSGAYRLSIPSGTGDYLVHFSAAGMKTLRRRLLRTGQDSVFLLDANLESATEILKPLTIEAQLPRPQRGPLAGAGTGSSELTVEGVSGAISPDQEGNLLSSLAIVNGVVPSGSGISVLGLSPDQNLVTLNGASFGGTALPRAALLRKRISTATYDPTHGDFSGAEISLELPSGSLFTRSRAYISVDLPALQSKRAPELVIGRSYSRVDASLGRLGQLKQGNFFYNAALQASVEERSADTYAHSLFAGSIQSVNQPPSFELLVSALENLRALPVDSSSRSHARARKVSLITRLDHSPFDPVTFGPSKVTWGLLGYASITSSDEPSLASVSRSVREKLWSGMGQLQAFHSVYLHKDILIETRASIARSRSVRESSPTLPSGLLLVDQQAADSAAPVFPVQFEGTGNAPENQSTWTFEGAQTGQLHLGRLSRHLAKFGIQARVEGTDDRNGANALGTFGYTSIADLANNRPVSFSRNLTLAAIRARYSSGALSVGDFWRIGPNLEVLYGIRAQTSLFRPSGLATVLGGRVFEKLRAAPLTDSYLSPRFGLTWRYRGSQTQPGLQASNIATVYTGPSGVLRGGIGEFGGTLSPRLIRRAYGSSFSTAGHDRLECLGQNVPIPDWSGFQSGLVQIPSSCMVPQGQVLGLAPNATFFHRDFRAPRSWRGNLRWESGLRVADFALEGIYSINRRQISSIDRNFAGVPQFVIADENLRPVFAPVAAVDTLSGLSRLNESRLDTAFGRLIEYQSKAIGITRQLSLTLTPRIDLSRFFVRGSYTLSQSRERANGFDGSTFFDPSKVEWARSRLDARHQFSFQAGFSTSKLAITAFARFLSGLPFTPLVGSDVNGDGLQNDRAFIFDPLSGSDGALLSSLSSLSRSAPEYAAKCMTRQTGLPAKKNSCEGPWTALANLRIAPAGNWLRARRTRVEINIANPLAGVDLLFHGTPHGWGNSPIPDPVLYFVRGFDPIGRTYKYKVNSHFGRPLAGINNPFRISIDVSIALGPTLAVQQLQRWLNPGRAGNTAKKLTAEQLRLRYARNVPDFYSAILEHTDSLLLNSEQVRAIQQLDEEYRHQIDSLWVDLTTYLSDLPDRFDLKSVLRKQESTMDEVWEVSRLRAQELSTVLTSEQLRILPWPADVLFRTKQRAHFRAYMSL